MKRKAILALVLLLILSAIGYVAFREADEQHDRKLLQAQMTQWDWNQSYAANHRRRVEGLRAVAPRIVPLLRRDLNFESRTRRGYDSVRHWIESHLHIGLGFSGSPDWDIRLQAAHTLAELGPVGKTHLSSGFIPACFIAAEPVTCLPRSNPTPLKKRLRSGFNSVDP